MVYTPFWVDPWQNLAQLIWPALAVGYRYSAVATRMTRSAMLEVLREDYIRTARAKGLWQKLILVAARAEERAAAGADRHRLEFAFLLGGLVVTEQVFNLNGLGMLFVEAIARRDYTLTQALVMLVATSSSWSTSRSTCLRVARPAHPLPLAMAVNPHRSRNWPTSPPREPSRRWLVGAPRFVRRRPLGALGARSSSW